MRQIQRKGKTQSAIRTVITRAKVYNKRNLSRDGRFLSCRSRVIEREILSTAYHSNSTP